MNVLILAGHEDTGGVHIALKQAFDRNPDLGITARTIRTQDNYIRYPADLQGNGSHWQLAHNWADVLHVNSDGFDVNVYGRLPPNKPVVMHHHGWHFRHNTLAWMRQAPKQTLHIVSTVDMQVEGTRWIPNPANIPWLRSFKAERSGPPHIMHAPTVRLSKGTATFLVALKKMAEANIDFTYQLVERKTWEQCLRRKGYADIYFDQFEWGFGLNAIEAWAMDIAVVSGATDYIEQKLIDHIGYLPFFKTDKKMVARDLAALCESPNLRAEWAKRGWQYINDFHDERKVARLWKHAYENLTA